VSSFFSVILGWIANRMVISLFGIILLALLVWFFGDQISFGGYTPLGSGLARIGFVLGTIIIWLVWHLVAALRSRKANENMLGSIAEEADKPQAVDPDQEASQEQLEALRERFRTALADLKTTNFGGKGQRRHLYQLPWYVIIGPPGAGKTTAIANSGLKFPLLDRFGRGSVKGVGGTRDCDWFFTDEAVLVDTAGRYVTQDSNVVVDSTAWQGFLGLLRKHRRRRPIDGIIVALSIGDIATDDAAKREEHARLVKQRIQEIYTVLKIRAPVYVIFTKCDLIAGFTDFFADLRQKDLEQVWGTTFPIARSRKPNGAIAGFNSDFDALLNRLSARVISRLQQETDIARRGLVFSFPQQIGLLKAPIEDFLKSAFGETRYDAPILLRGVYMSSATQEGTPVDRLVGALARAYGFEQPSSPPFAQRGRCYFLTRLLRDVVFRESALATATGFFERHRAWLLRAYYAAAVGVTVVFVAGMATSYVQNRPLVSEADRAAAEYESRYRNSPPGNDSLVDDLWYLNQLRDLPGGYAHRSESPNFLMSLWFYQGDKLGSAAIEKYRQALQTILMPRIMSRLEEQLLEGIQGEQGPGEFLQLILKVYLMMTTPSKRDADLTYSWITKDWEIQNPGAQRAALRQEFNSHVQALVELVRQPFPENHTLVRQAQQALTSVEPAKRLYEQIKAEGLRDRGVGFSLAQLPAPSQRYFEQRGRQSTAAGVPRFFTVDGYHLHFIPEREQAVNEGSQDSWIFGRTRLADQDVTLQMRLRQEIGEMYFAEYINTWQAFLDSIDVVAEREVQAQANLVRALMGTNSPIKTLLEGVAKQTHLAVSLAPDAGEEKASGVSAKISKLLGDDRVQELGPPDPAVQVDDYFATLHQLVDRAEGAPAQIDPVLNTLQPLFECLSDAALTLGTDREILAPGRETIARCQKAARDVDNEARLQPPPLNRWLQDVALSSLKLVRGSVGTELTTNIQDAWRSQVVPKCREMLSNRFPLVRNSTEDINVSDFARFFGPDGVMDRFFKEFIRPAVNTSSRPWEWSGQVPVGISRRSLKLFESAAKIKDAYFPVGSLVPSVVFEVEPVKLDTHWAQVTFEIGDQKLLYRHDRPRRYRFEWPTPRRSSARVGFTPISGEAMPASISASGDWALFHLLDQSKVSVGSSPDRFEVGFAVDGFGAEFRIYAASTINPFFLPALTQFRCEDRL
jgi:type VI secretion system protein ImpL